MELTWLDAILTFAAALLAFHGGRLLQRAQSQNVNVQTIASLSQQVNQLVEDRRKDREELDALRDRLEQDDDFKEVVKKYFAELLDYFKEKGITDYPKPPDVLDTNPKMKSIRKAKI